MLIEIMPHNCIINLNDELLKSYRLKSQLFLFFNLTSSVTMISG